MNKATNNEGVWLHGYDVKVGDVIDGYRLTPGGEDTRLGISKDAAVVKLKEVSTIGDSFHTGSGEFHFSRANPREWHVINRPAVKLYNALCDRCGLGMFIETGRIEHEGGTCNG